MRAGQVFAQSPYGAFELKRSYQRNMLMGTLISCAIPVVVMILMALIGFLRGLKSSNEVMPASDVVYVDLSQLPPPNIQKVVNKPEIQREKIELPKIGVPNPVADEEVMEVQVLATNLEKVDISAADVAGASDGSVYGDGTVIDILDDIMPKPDEFVPYDEEPVLLVRPEPEYPEMARKAGIEGDVWVKVLVDKEGNVRDAILVKESGVNAGFEQAALDAAKKRKYKPAMQNNQPVPVWIAFKIRFTLTGRH